MSARQIHHGDALAFARSLPDASVDSLVTDPPAGIGFMGKSWDKDKGGRDAWIAWLREILTECLRALKPGGHALVWALPRTAHWTATAVEDAGFEVRDVVAHLFGTGFPKSLNVGDGRGTALKPAAEHWILARKPLVGTVAANVTAHGTGAINVDACRVAGPPSVGCQTGDGMGFHGSDGERRIDRSVAAGRWPANVILSHLPTCGDACADGCAVATLDGQSGIRLGMSGGGKHAPGYGGGMFGAIDSANTARGDTGGASRFFYVAKPSRSEREAGLGHLPTVKPHEIEGRKEGSAGSNHARSGMGNGARANVHPTVKSIALMRYLVRLVTPPGGVVLDVFAGSGTTALACVAEGLSFVGCEREAEYVEIARGRLSHAEGMLWPSADYAQTMRATVPASASATTSRRWSRVRSCAATSLRARSPPRRTPTSGTASGRSSLGGSWCASKTRRYCLAKSTLTRRS